jgi:hypothetical protein
MWGSLIQLSLLHLWLWLPSPSELLLLEAQVISVCTPDVVQMLKGQPSNDSKERLWKSNLTFSGPCPMARTWSSLDHVTDGRIGWNVVTGFNDSGARAMGLDQIIPHDERYERADEYMGILYKYVPPNSP